MCSFEKGRTDYKGPVLEEHVLPAATTYGCELGGHNRVGREKHLSSVTTKY